MLDVGGIEKGYRCFRGMLVGLEIDEEIRNDIFEGMKVGSAFFIVGYGEVMLYGVYRW